MNRNKISVEDFEAMPERVIRNQFDRAILTDDEVTQLKNMCRDLNGKSLNGTEKNTIENNINKIKDLSEHDKDIIVPNRYYIQDILGTLAWINSAYIKAYSNKEKVQVVNHAKEIKKVLNISRDGTVSVRFR